MELVEQQRVQIQSFDDSAPHAAQTGTGSVSLLGLIEPFFANKRLILSCVLASMLVGWIALLVLPRKYESEARLLIKVGRESVSLDPTATTSETMMLQKTQEEEINSVLEVMSSREVMGRTVELLGTGPILDGYLPNKERKQSSLEHSFLGPMKSAVSEGLFKVLVAAGLKDGLSDHEEAIMELKKSIGIYARKKSTVVIINSASRSPDMAQAMSQALVDAYLDEHLRTSRTEGSQKFFENQAGTAEEQLNNLLDRRTAMLQARDIESIESTRTTLLNSLTNLETTVRGRLNDLELQEVELASKVTREHPEFQRLSLQIDEMRQAVETLQSDRNRKGKTVVVRAAMQRDRASSEKSSSTALRLLNQKRRLQKELGELMDFQLELDDVERSIGVVQDRLYKLREKQEEARLIDELQSKRISNISVIQPASFVERPASPNKKLLAAGFTGLGLMMGLGLVVIREINSNKIRSTHQLGSFREELVVVDLPSQSKLFSRFNSKTSSHWKTPVMRRQLGPVLQEIASMPRKSGNGIVVGVTGISKGVGTTSVAAALAEYADAECIDTLLVTEDPPASPSKSSGSNGEPASSLAVPNSNYAISERVQYLNGGSLKKLSHEDCIGVNLHEFREELSRWMRIANELTIVDLSPRSGRNSNLDVEMLDCVVVVAQAERSTSVELARSLRRLGAQRVPVAAVVLNKTRRAIPWWIERLVS